MDERVRVALARDRIIDITTIGRVSAAPRRIEIWFHRVDGRIYITGLPGRRDWYANLLATPDFTFHLKQTATADLAARAVPITDAAARREVLSRILQDLEREQDLETWMADSPLVAVDFAEFIATG